MTHSGGKQHAVGDRGQRYEIRAIGWPDEGEGVIGWNENAEGAERTAASIRKAPGCTKAWVIDRRPV